MKYRQLLLAKIAEECAEVAQRALKAQQFGLYEYQKNTDKNNLDRLEEEFVDLLTVYDMLYEVINRETPFKNNTHFGQKMKEKREKIGKYHEYSVALGEVDKD